MKNLIKKYLGINDIIEQAKYNENILQALQQENYLLSNELANVKNDLHCTRDAFFELTTEFYNLKSDFYELQTKVDELDS